MRTRTTLALGLAIGAALAVGAGELKAYYGELIGTTVVKQSQLRAVPGREGTVRTYIGAPTSTLLNLGLRATTLDPGASSNPARPYSQAIESLILVKDGVLEVKLDEKGEKVEQLDAGSAIFLGPNQWHAIRNATQQPVTFYEVDWVSPGMNGEPGYPEAVINRPRRPMP